MSNDVALIIKGAISELPEEMRLEAMKIHDDLMAIVKEKGASAIFAIALAGAELGDQ